VANVEVKLNIDVTKLVEELQIGSKNIFFLYLSRLLDTDTPIARDWLICKIAQFRGVSESEAESFIDTAWSSGSSSDS
jgi:hypothetical protein